MFNALAISKLLGTGASSAALIVGLGACGSLNHIISSNQAPGSTVPASQQSASAGGSEPSGSTNSHPGSTSIHSGYTSTHSGTAAGSTSTAGSGSSHGTSSAHGTGPSGQPSPPGTIGSNSGSGQGSHGTPVVSKDIDHFEPSVEPSEMSLSGDATNNVRNLTWHSWSSAGASATGIWDYNDCNPDCGDGHVRPVPVAIQLSQPVNGDFSVLTERAAGLDHNPCVIHMPTSQGTETRTCG